MTKADIQTSGLYCKNSPTLDKTALHAAIVRALNRFSTEDETTCLTLMKATIGEAIGLNGGISQNDPHEIHLAVAIL